MPPRLVVARDSFPTSAFIDVSNFTTMEGAINRAIEFITYLQSRMKAIPCKWGQSSSNLGCVHPLQLTAGLRCGDRLILDDPDLCDQPSLTNHPSYRTELQTAKIVKLSYHKAWFKQVVIEAVLVWPTCFVGEDNDAWKVVLGQAELYAMNNWTATHGADLNGMREPSNNSGVLKYPPTKSSELLSYIYSARYHSVETLKEEKVWHMQEAATLKQQASKAKAAKVELEGGPKVKNYSTKQIRKVAEYDTDDRRSGETRMFV